MVHDLLASAEIAAAAAGVHLDQRVCAPSRAQHQHHWLLRLLLQLQPATLAGTEQPVNGLDTAKVHNTAGF